MARFVFLPALILLATAAGTIPGRADDTATLASLPANISQVVSAGSWSDGGKSGFYRAVVLVSGTDATHFSAKVYLQWLSIASGDTTPSVVASVPVTQVNAVKLPNAAVDMFAGGNGSGQITFVVSTVDPRTRQETDFYGTATSPGHYSMPLPGRAGQ